MIKREIRRDYLQAGFSECKGKGDHVIFLHPLVSGSYSLDGTGGADALRYDEKNLRQALQALEEAQRSQQP
jgi:hypothetical protein